MADPAFGAYGTAVEDTGINEQTVTITGVTAGDLVFVLCQSTKINKLDDIVCSSPSLTLTELESNQDAPNDFGVYLYGEIAPSTGTYDFVCSFSEEVSWFTGIAFRYDPGSITDITPHATWTGDELIGWSESRTVATDITTTARCLIMPVGTDWNDYWDHSVQGSWNKRITADVTSDATVQFVFDQVADADDYPDGNFSTADGDPYVSFIVAIEVPSAGAEELSPQHMSSSCSIPDPLLSFHPASLFVDNLSSDSTVGSTVLGMVLKANSMESSSLVSKVQMGMVLKASDLESASAVDDIVLGMVLKAANLSSTSSIDSTTINKILSVANMSSDTQVQATILNMVLIASDMASASTIEDITVLRNRVLAVANLSSNSTVENVVVGMVLKALNIASATSIPAGEWLEIVIAGFKTLSPAHLSSATTVDDVLLSFNPASLQINSMSSSSTIEDVTLAMCLTPGDMESLSTVGTITLGTCLVVADLSSASTVGSVLLQKVGVSTLVPVDMSAATVVDDVVVTRMRRSGVKITGIDAITGEPVLIIGTQIVSYPLP